MGLTNGGDRRLGWLGWAVSLGVGLISGPRGTYGSLLTAGGLWLWWAAGGGALRGVWYWVFLAGFSLLAVWLAGRAEREEVFGPGRDPGQIVIDEAAGLLLACYGLGAEPWWEPWLALAAFRLFDITKPFPAGRSQDWPGGWGVVADDLWAGLYALGVVRLVRLWLG